MGDGQRKGDDRHACTAHGLRAGDCMATTHRYTTLPSLAHRWLHIQCLVLVEMKIPPKGGGWGCSFHNAEQSTRTLVKNPWADQSWPICCM